MCYEVMLVEEVMKLRVLRVQNDMDGMRVDSGHHNSVHSRVGQGVNAAVVRIWEGKVVIEVRLVDVTMIAEGLMKEVVV